MNKSQSGFTLIELVVVIVLLGILGVTALGKFQDLSVDAANAATTGVASELAAASALNYAKGIVSGTYPETISAANVCTAPILGNLLSSGSLPTEITPSSTGNCATAGAGNTVTCDLDHDSGDTTAIASIVCGG